MFQGLKSHKPEFADELVRSNEKGPPSEPSTYHKYMDGKQASSLLLRLNVTEMLSLRWSII